MTEIQEEEERESIQRNPQTALAEDEERGILRQRKQRFLK